MGREWKWNGKSGRKIILSNGFGNETEWKWNGDGINYKLTMELMWNKNGLFSGISGRGEWRRNGDKFIFEMEFEWNGMELEWNGMEMESKWNM